MSTLMAGRNPGLLLVAVIIGSGLTGSVDADETIDLGSQPAKGTETATYHELWRAGGEDDDVFFGNVLQVSAGPGGEIYVLDVQLVQVFVFSAGGEFLRTVGQHGEGPGEVNNINSIAVLPDGRIGLGQVLPGKLVMIDAAGEPAGAYRLIDPEAPDSGFVLMMNSHAGPSLLAVAGMRWSMSDAGELVQTMFLRSYDHEGQPGADLFSKTSAFDASHFVFDELKYDFVWNRFGVLSDERICFAPHRNAYEIVVCKADGSDRRVLTRAHDSVRRNDDERKQAEMSTEAIGLHYGRELRGVTIEDTEPDITGLWPNPDGAIWVRTSEGDRDAEAGVLTTVDILDPTGSFLARRRIVCPGDARRDGIHFLPGDRVVVVTGAVEAYRRDTGAATDESSGGEEIPLEIICYGIN